MRYHPIDVEPDILPVDHPATLLFPSAYEDEDGDFPALYRRRYVLRELVRSGLPMEAGSWH